MRKYHILDFDGKLLCMSKFEELMRKSLEEEIHKISMHYASWDLDEEENSIWCPKCRGLYENM